MRFVSVFPLFTGTYGPEEGWSSAYPECRERNQSPINIADQDTKVSTEYQELTLDGFEAESSNKTSMKNTGKTGETHYPNVIIFFFYHYAIALNSMIRTHVSVYG